MHRQLLFVLVPLFLLNCVFSAYLSLPRTLGDIVTQPPDITASADIDYHPIILVKPEKRIPPLHNDSLLIDISLRPVGSGTSVYSTTGITDQDGILQIGPVPSSLISQQYYDVLIKGLSHLRRLFPNQDFYQGAGLTLDLRSPILLAGDSHPTADNYINALDISYEIINLYTSDLRADLNRDTIVNSLEFPTLISHLYQTGDE